MILPRWSFSETMLPISVHVLPLQELRRSYQEGSRLIAKYCKLRSIERQCDLWFDVQDDAEDPV